MTDQATPQQIPAYGEPLHRMLEGSLTGHLEPVRLSWTYRLALMVVALAMLALPLVYLAIAGAVLYGLWIFLSYIPTIIQSTSSAQAKLLMVGAPLVIGLLLLFFLFKPLLARRARPAAPLKVSRQSEPVLFAFVDRLAERIGAPKPREIRVDSQVNASASFRRGFWSLFGNDLTLTIGLPLVAGMTLSQLAGVLAHELGHFAQRTALRFSFAIRGVNAWFHRVVYERDAWDVQLQQASRKGDFRIGIVLGLARGGIWLSRRILHLLMLTGHGLSCYLLRQMEYDADRYETRLVGPQVFEETVHSLLVLGAAHQLSLDDLDAMWSEGRLSDDLARLVQANRARVADRVAPAIRQHLETAKTGTFDTHPSDRDRIANARREKTPPVFDQRLPATVLFRDFPSLSRKVSRHFYEAALGEPVDPKALVSSDEVVDRQDRARAGQEAVKRFFPAGLHPWRPLPIEAAYPWASAGNADVPSEAGEFEIIQTTLERQGKVLLERLEQWLELESRRLGVLQAEALIHIGFRIDAKEFHLPKADPLGVDRALTVTASRQQALETELQAGEQLQAQRLQLALGALEPDRKTLAELTRLWDAAVQLTKLGSRHRDLRERFSLLHILALQVAENLENAKLLTRVVEVQEALSRRLKALARKLYPSPYPFDHAQSDLDLGSWVVPSLPPVDDLGAVHGATQMALQRLDDLYWRVFGALAEVAETAETAA